MRNVRKIISLAAAVLAIATGQGFCVIYFNDGGTHNIDSLIPGDVWVDYGAPGMQTTVNVLDGGGILGPGGDNYWGVLEAYNDCTINVFGGYVDTLNAYDSTIVNIAGYHISKLNAWDYTTVNILPNGTVNGPCVFRDNSHVFISGGFFAGNLTSCDTSNITITGGNFRDDHNTYLIATQSSTVDISGGFVNMLRPYDISNVTISGGRVKQLSAYETSITTFYGYDFTGTGGVTLNGNNVLGTGELNGKWMDGTGWTTNINIHEADAIILAINITTIPPNAEAGSDQTLMDSDDNGSEEVTLDGSGSSDSYGDIVSWVWTDDLGDTIPDGEITTAALSVGIHTITLTVTDNDGLTDTDTVTVTVEPYPNQPPIADADGPYSIYVGDTLTLDGSGSTDEDNDIVSYLWDLDDNNIFETEAGGQAIFDVNYTYLQSLGLIVDNTYNIHLKVTDSKGQSDTADSTLTIIPQPALQAAVDIKPGSCPNPLNVKSSGVLPVAILGTVDVNVTDIDPTSVQLAGVGVIRHSFEDVATPVADSNDCNCTEDGPDGFLDLTLKFKTKEIVNAIGDVNDGDVMVLGLTGVLYDERPIEGEDCVLIIGKHKPCNKADFNSDGKVDMEDFAEFAGNWLKVSSE